MGKPLDPNKVYSHSHLTVGRSRIVDELLESRHMDTTAWNSVCALTLTLKQGFYSKGFMVPLDENQCVRAFNHFMNLLNRRVYRNAFYRHGKRLRVIPIMEKELPGAYHLHSSLERPAHISELGFKYLINSAWSRVDWANERISIVFDSDEGWKKYMLKAHQKAGLDSWLNCIVWDCLFNPIADV
jgi:hypothetical protein